MKFPPAEEYFRRIHRIMQLLDENNIRIIEAMNKFGPRNLQLISRELDIPYPTLYSRVARLGEEGVLSVFAYADFARIGLSRCMVLVDPQPGKELLVREALRIPNYWVKLMRCMGECNGIYSQHAVPRANQREFEEYIDQFLPLGIASKTRIHWLGNHHSFIPNFEYYDLAKRKWRFDWSQWLKTLSNPRKVDVSIVDENTETKSSKSPGGTRPVSFDNRDLYVLKELCKDATVKLADLARVFKITLPAAKYRYESVVKKGLVQENVFDILPYAPEISDLYEIRLDFRTIDSMRSSANVLGTLPFVLSVSTIKGLQSLAVRVYLPRGEMNNMITMLSTLAQNGVLTNFTYLWLDGKTLKSQTFSYEKYVEGVGWSYDNREYNTELQNLLASVGKGPLAPPSFEPMSLITIQ